MNEQELREVLFPFHWDYADIVELDEEEKEKFAWRGCDLCNKKEIEFRKISAGCPSLLCYSCAVDYVGKAQAFQKKLDKISGDNLSKAVLIQDTLEKIMG